MEVEIKSLSHYLLCDTITEVAFGEGVFQCLHPAPDAASTLKRLDRETSVGSLTLQPMETGEISILKLFTALTWYVGSGRWGNKSQFSVWCMMPASMGGEVSVGLVDTDCMSAEQFRTSSWADYLYDTKGIVNTFNDMKDGGGVRVRYHLY